MDIIGELLAMANGLLFAFSNIFNKRALDQMDKESGMLVTLVVNNVVNASGLLMLYLAGKWVPMNAAAIVWFVLAGALTSFFGRYLLFESVRLNGPSRAGAYKVTSPVFTLFIGTMVLSERLSPGSLAGAVLALGGLWIISIRNLPAEDEGRSVEKQPWYRKNAGPLIGLISGLSFAIGMIARKVGMQVWASSLAGAFLGSMTALALTLASFLYRSKSISWRVLIDKKAANYVWSGVCTSLAIICFFLALQYIPVAIANVIGSLEPLFTVGLAYLMLRNREPITWNLILGALTVTLGVGLIFVY